MVAGLGYVGLPLAMRAVAAGHEVTGYDPDAARVKRLEAGESYVEDVPAGELSAALRSGRFRPSTDAGACSGFDVAVITVPTPLRDGLPDLGYVEAASRTLAGHLRRGATVILESTSYPGTTQEQVANWLEEGSGLVTGQDFHLGYSPERIDPGNRTWTLATTPKIVSGIDGESLAAVQDFYAGIVARTVPVSSPREAELAKLIENTFRHVNIALMNELAMFGHELGVDVWEAIDAASTKPFGYMPFRPGPGVGGHCLPIDPSYLSWRVERTLGQRFRFVELANEINSHMPDYVVRRLLLALNECGRAAMGARVLLLGLAYKKNTGDARESPAIRIAELLIRLGAHVRAADPLVTEDAVIGWPWPASRPPKRSSRRPTSWSCSPSTTPSRTPTSAATRSTCWTAGGSWPARTSRRCDRARRRRGGHPAQLHEGQTGDGRARAARVRVTLVHTGQHYDAAMSAVFFTELGLRAGRGQVRGAARARRNPLRPHSVSTEGAGRPGRYPRPDSNGRPAVPETAALSNCATGTCGHLRRPRDMRARGGTRTPNDRTADGFTGRCAAYCATLAWGDRRGSNAQPPGSRPGALPG